MKMMVSISLEIKYRSVGVLAAFFGVFAVLFNFLLKCSLFIVLRQFLLYSKVTQLYIYILLSVIVCPRRLDIVPCAM